MTSPKFRQIPAPLHVDDDALARLADQLGVPKLVTPSLEPPIADEIPSVDKPEAVPRPSPSPKADKPTSAQKKPPGVETMKFSAQIPVYVSLAINQRAAQERCTVRHLLLKAMRAIGIEVDDADLVPDRRRPAKRPRR